MRVIEGGNYSYTRRVKYPIVVSEDTEFRQANFAQETPHTDGVFAVAPGVKVRFVGCNLVNVKVPDGAEIVGGNLAHIVTTPTGDAARPTVNLLHECEACACARQEMQDCLDGKAAWVRDEKGRVLHHAMKERFRARRLSVKRAADLTKHAAENDAAVTRFGRTLTRAQKDALGRA